MAQHLFDQSLAQPAAAMLLHDEHVGDPGERAVIGYDPRECHLLVARVDLRGKKKGRFVIKVVAVTGQNRRVSETRRYRTCKPKRR